MPSRPNVGKLARFIQKCSDHMTKETDKKFKIEKYVNITSWKVCGVKKSTVPRTEREGKTRVMEAF